MATKRVLVKFSPSIHLSSYLGVGRGSSVIRAGQTYLHPARPGQFWHVKQDTVCTIQFDMFWYNMVRYDISNCPVRKFVFGFMGTLNSLRDLIAIRRIALITCLDLLQSEIH